MAQGKRMKDEEGGECGTLMLLMTTQRQEQRLAESALSLPYESLS